MTMLTACVLCVSRRPSSDSGSSISSLLHRNEKLKKTTGEVLTHTWSHDCCSGDVCVCIGHVTHILAWAHEAIFNILDWCKQDDMVNLLLLKNAEKPSSCRATAQDSNQQPHGVFTVCERAVSSSCLQSFHSSDKSYWTNLIQTDEDFRHDKSQDVLHPSGEHFLPGSVRHTDSKTRVTSFTNFLLLLQHLYTPGPFTQWLYKDGRHDVFSKETQMILSALWWLAAV